MEAEQGAKEAMEAEQRVKEAMAVEQGVKEAMAAEKRTGEEGVVAAEEDKGEGATVKGKGVAEEKELGGVKMIAVTSLDGEKRSMSVAAAKLSVILKGMIDDGFGDKVIPLENVATGRTLDTVIEYCTKHAAEPVKSDPVAAAATSAVAGSSGGGVITADDWDRKLVDSLSMDDLYDFLHAAHFLEIKGLLDVVYQKVADMIKGKTPNQIRATFNIANDFTPEEEAELRQQYVWTFDK